MTDRFDELWCKLHACEIQYTVLEKTVAEHEERLESMACQIPTGEIIALKLNQDELFKKLAEIKDRLYNHDLRLDCHADKIREAGLNIAAKDLSDKVKCIEDRLERVNTRMDNFTELFHNLQIEHIANQNTVKDIKDRLHDHNSRLDAQSYRLEEARSNINAINHDRLQKSFERDEFEENKEPAKLHTLTLSVEQLAFLAKALHYLIIENEIANVEKDGDNYTDDDVKMQNILHAAAIYAQLDEIDA